MTHRNFTFLSIAFGALLASGGAAQAQVSPCPIHIQQDELGADVGTFDSRTVSADRQASVPLSFFVLYVYPVELPP